MPATRLDRFSRPRRDPIKALIQDRIQGTRFSQENLAEVLDVCRATASTRMTRQHTEEWTLGEVKKLCSALKVEVDPNEAATICRCLGIQIRREAGAAANSV